MTRRKSPIIDFGKGYGAVSWLKNRDKNKRGGNPLSELEGGRRFSDSLVVLAESYLDWLVVRNYSPTTCRGVRLLMGLFCHWASERDLERASQITKPILESYQRWIFYYRKTNGKPLGNKAQRDRMGILRRFFSWACRQNHLLFNPACDLELPRLQSQLPEECLTPEQITRVLSSVGTGGDLLEIRDRAILELFYSTGIRRSELARLECGDIAPERRTLRVRQGKGNKDRVIPVSLRALEWVERYLETSRPQLARDEERALFVTGYGTAFNVDVLGRLVVKYLRRAGVSSGGCHLFRHTCATHMLENGADIRFIQQLLGHSDLASTQIYTQVSIQALQEVYQRTHPAAVPQGEALAGAPSCAMALHGKNDREGCL